MNKREKYGLGVTLLLSIWILAGTRVQGAPYELSWYTVDGGGGTSSGGQYTLASTIGQPDAAYSSGGKYELLSGFWPGGPVCFVEFDDFARFADYWLATGYGLPADLYEDGSIDWNDLREFAYEWLYECPRRWPLR